MFSLELALFFVILTLREGDTLSRRLALAAFYCAVAS